LDTKLIGVNNWQQVADLLLFIHLFMLFRSLI
jgi:hypothetical protein